MRSWPLLVVTACGRIGFDPHGTGDGGALVLDITIIGGGAVTGPGIACADHCTYSTDAVTLTAVPMETWQLASWSNGCGSQVDCAVSTSETITVTFTQAPITANVAFVSSGLGPWTGLANMDSFCMTSAGARGLSGNFVALLSTASMSAPMRLAGHRGWVRRDGLPVLDQPSDLATPMMLPRAILLDESGTPQIRKGVTTGTSASGAVSNQGVCGDWTTQTGSTEGGISTFAADSLFSLDGTDCAARQIYCFQIDHSTAVDLNPPAFPVGRYVFLSSTRPTPGGGVSAFDALCAADATTAGLPGTYRALVATETESVTQHVGSVAGIWRRPDGIVVTRVGLDHVPLDAAINVTAAGTRLGQKYTWFGARDFTSLGSESCSSWTSAVSAVTPNLSASDVALDLTYNTDCASLAEWLLCAQM
jgi:hypothetical protein